MKGVARTVFAGKEIESFDLEVLGVLRNFAGPKQDIILVRLLGDKPNYTGVVAGMSGSPGYLDGKLAGALAYRFGAFTKEPIAGVTPIADMLRAGEEQTPATAATADSSGPRRHPLPDGNPAPAGSSEVVRSAAATPPPCTASSPCRASSSAKRLMTCGWKPTKATGVSMGTR